MGSGNHTAAAPPAGMDGMDMTGGAAPAMAMDHVHSCDAVFDPSKPYHYGHGAYLGHMLPGCFFLVWGSWWAIGVIAAYVKANASRQPYRARTWFKWPCAPQFLARVPLEPILKIALPFIGINGELWMGHESWRNMYAADGTFFVDNLNDWQHSCMYLAFMISGLVDLLGCRRPLPAGTGQAFLALAFAVEGILLGFHLKGPEFEVIIHKLLVFTIFFCVAAIAAEAALPANPVVSLMRAGFVVLQGTWFMQVAKMMYNVPYEQQWNPCYMGSAMFAPVVYSTHLLLVFFCLLLAMVVGDYVHEMVYGRSPAPGAPAGGARYQKVGTAETIEMGIVGRD